MIIFDPSQSSYGNRLQTAAEVAGNGATPIP